MKVVKQCTKCKEYKCLCKFYKDNRMRNGLHSECKACANALKKQWRAKNKLPNYQI